VALVFFLERVLPFWLRCCPLVGLCWAMLVNQREDASVVFMSCGAWS